MTLLVAFSGYVVKYINDLRLAQRKDRLERVNLQLRELYGPLFSLINVSTITWKAFVEQYCRNQAFRTKNGILPKTEEAESIWRHWMQNVFMPLNLKMAQLITDHTDLLEDEEMPDCLLKLSAHVHGYKGIIAAWEEKDYSRHVSLTPFPVEELFGYMENLYRKLKTRQSQLIGRHK